MSSLYCNYELDLNSGMQENENNFLDIKWRVKLYDLNPDGQWDDKGTGFVFIFKEVSFIKLTTFRRKTTIFV